MAQFEIIQSADLAQLVQQLIAKRRAYRKHIFAEDVVIVSSMAIADYLEQTIAKEEGIATRLNYQFWGSFEWSLIERVPLQGEETCAAPLSKDAMQWDIFAYLLAHGNEILQEEHHPLYPHLFELCRKQHRLQEAHIQSIWNYSLEIARIFLDYQAMRPDWLQAWMEGKLDFPSSIQLHKTWLKAHYHGIWQAQAFLWNTLFKEIFLTRQARSAHFWQYLEQGDIEGILPEQLHLFAPYILNEDMLLFLEKLSTYIPVVLYHHCVSEGYLNDIVDSRYLRQLKLIGKVDEADHLDSGNVLVSRLGKQMRSRARLLERYGKTDVTVLEGNYAQNTPLACLQYDIAHLQEGEAHLVEVDDSLRLYACHSMRRQLEVLKDEIITWLNADNTRRLDDIVVLMPDVKRYQNLIREVFAQGGDADGYHLPIRITGVNSINDNHLWQAVVGIFSLAMGDFTYQAVKAWWNNPLIIQHYDLDKESLDKVLHALGEAGFYRAFDIEQLTGSATPKDGDYRFTFEYALERLALGVNVGEDGLWCNHHPAYGALALDSAKAIHALCEFFQEIQTIRKNIHQNSHSDHLEQLFWLNALEERLHAFESQASATREYARLSLAIEQLKQVLQVHDNLRADHSVSPNLPLSFIVRYLLEQVENQTVSSEPSGVITFGRVGVLRGLPYRLIAFLGAEDRNFPYKQQDSRYNLITVDKRRESDRDQLWNDQASFLEMLMSARENCWLFATLFESNERVLGSSVLEELRDYMQVAFPNCSLPNCSLEKKCMPYPIDSDPNIHPSPLMAELQVALQEHHRAQRRASFFHFKPLPNQRESNGGSVRLEEMKQVFANSLASYLQKEGFAKIKEYEARILEPFAKLNAINEWKVRAQSSLETSLPAGIFKDRVLAKTQEERERYWQQLAHVAHRTPSPTPLKQTEVVCEDWQIIADLPQEDDVCLLVLPHRKKGKHYLEAYWRHLLWKWHNPKAKETWIHFWNERALIWDESALICFEKIEQEKAKEQLLAWLSAYEFLRDNPFPMQVDEIFKNNKLDEKWQEKLITAHTQEPYLAYDKLAYKKLAYKNLLFAQLSKEVLEAILAESAPAIEALFASIKEERI